MFTRTRFALIFALLCGTALGQTAFYVSPGFTGGSDNGSPSHPWTSLQDSTSPTPWTAINTALGSGAVTVYFSAIESQTSQVQYASGSVLGAGSTGRTDTGTNVLTLDGITEKNTTLGATPTWVTNVVPANCKYNAAGCNWPSASKYTITAHSPFESSDSPFNCQGYITIQGFTIQDTDDAAMDATYTHHLTIQFNDISRTALGGSGPGVYIGPGNSGPCHTGAARPGGTDSGPDNVTVQYNHIYNTWGECIYDGADTPDPFSAGTPSCTNTGGQCQQYEAGNYGGTSLNLSCGNGNTSSSVLSLTPGTPSTCSTGANHLINKNVIESCAVWGGQGDGIDAKDGHSNLQITGNSLDTGKTPTCAPTCSQTPGNDGRGMVLESVSLVDGNEVQEPQHDGVDLVDSWNNSVGRTAARVSNDLVVNVNSGVGNNNCYELEPLNVAGLSEWGNVSFLNDSAFSCTGNGISIANSATGTVTATNGIYQSTAGHSYAIGTASFNDYFSSGSCPNSESGTICTNPLFVSTTPPYLDTNFELQGGSGALGVGANLSSTFTTDYFGTTRTVPWSMGMYQPASGASFTASPTTVPANHSGHITVTLTGSGTSWTGSTSFSLSGVSGVTLVSSTNNSSTSQTLVITTGSSTGTLTISDTTDSISTTISVATATLAISPTSGNVSTTPSLALTGANTLWSSETASTLFSVSGGSCSGESLATPTISSNTAATATLTTGSAACTITVTDNSTTATATFTVNAIAIHPVQITGHVVISGHVVIQ